MQIYKYAYVDMWITYKIFRNVGVYHISTHNACKYTYLFMQNTCLYNKMGVLFIYG